MRQRLSAYKEKKEISGRGLWCQSLHWTIETKSRREWRWWVIKKCSRGYVQMIYLSLFHRCFERKVSRLLPLSIAYIYFSQKYPQQSYWYQSSRTAAMFSTATKTSFTYSNLLNASWKLFLYKFIATAQSAIRMSSNDFFLLLSPK